MKSLYFLICLFFASLPTIAQDTLTGVVTEKGSRKPISFASVFITDKQKNGIAFSDTDEKGNFALVIPASFTNGTIHVHYIEFEDFTQDIASGSLPKNLAVQLVPKLNELKEVVVDARQKAVSIKGDKMIFNVEAAGIGNGNNGLETIRLIPGMRLDKDENLVFRGSANIQVMINGKKSLLTGDALREYIRSLKGSDIASIEIIAQPSARYEASGTAGIVNIVLKKNRKAGYSGNVSSTAYYGEYLKTQQGGRLFYNDSLWTINANGYYYNGQSVNHRHIRQTIAVEEGARVIDQYNTWVPITRSASLNMAAERRIGKNQAISTEWQYYSDRGTEHTDGFTNEYLNGIRQNNVKLTQYFATPEKRIAGNVFYNYTSDSATTKLDVQSNFARYSTRKDGFQKNSYTNGTYMNLEGKNKTAYTIANVQADFNHKLSDKINFEAGAKYAYVKMDYYNRYTTDNNQLLIIPDSLLTNNFKYDEKLASVYAQAAGDFGKWTVQAGLRTEYYAYKALSEISRKTNKSNYTNLFPSFSLGYKQENSQYQFSYSRRIGRPDYLSLNPYYQYLDAYTLQIGNPGLKPQYYDSFQLGYIYKSALNLSLYGYLYKNGFMQVIDYQQQQNYNITYEANAARGSRFGASASLPWQPAKWWTMQLSFDTYLNSERSDIQNFDYDGTGFGYDLNFYQSAELKGDWKLSMNGFYTGRSTTPNGFSIATYDFSLSAKKSLFKKKLLVAAGCNNILKKSLYNHTTQVNNVSTNWTNRWETRRFYLQLTYNFGSGKNKQVKATSLDEETNRI